MFGGFAEPQLIDEQRVEAHDGERHTGVEDDRGNALAGGDRRQRRALGRRAQRAGPRKAGGALFAHHRFVHDQALL